MAKQKQHQDITKLREAGKIARQQLVDKGILSDKSIIDRIEQDKTKPRLPGIPAYLPREYTLEASQKMMLDLMVIWFRKYEGSEKKQENIGNFFKFIIKEMLNLEKKFRKEEKQMKTKIEKEFDKKQILKEVFSPTQKRETAYAMAKFFADSFAISIIVRSNECTSDYALWFLNWTKDLLALWKITTNEQPFISQPRK